MLPSLARLTRQRRDEDKRRGPSDQDPAIDVFPTTLFTAESGILKNLYDYWNPHLTSLCDIPPNLHEERPRTLVATSDLWGRREFNVSESVKTWEHLSSHSEILEFFSTASESTAGTLAHVVLTRKKHKHSSTPRACRNAKGMDTCDHGHLAIVLQPVYWEPLKADAVTSVVSMGFFPETGNANNLNPLYRDNGLVRVPDPMVANWKHQLAGVPEEGDHYEELKVLDGKETEHIRVLKTFVYPPDKMKMWLDVFKISASRLSRKYDGRDVEEEDLPAMYEEGFEVRGLPYSMYGGVPALGRLSTLPLALSHLRHEMTRLEEKLTVVTAHNGFDSLNCATFVLAAFPEGNLSCPLGIPAACSDATPSGSPYFDTLEGGVLEMVKEAKSVAEAAEYMIRDRPFLY